MHPRTRLVYFYFLRVNFLVKASTSGRSDQVWLPWQRYICRSRYGCFCLSPQVTYLHTKIEGGLNFFISNFASLSWRIALKWQIKLLILCLALHGPEFSSWSHINCLQEHLTPATFTKLIKGGAASVGIRNIKLFNQTSWSLLTCSDRAELIWSQRKFDKYGRNKCLEISKKASTTHE